MEGCTNESVSVQELERGEPISSTAMGHISASYRQASTLKYTGPEGLTRRCSSQPTYHTAINTPERRSYSVPPLEGSIIQHPDISHPFPLLTTNPQCNLESFKPERRNARASSLPLDSRQSADLKIQYAKGRPVRSNSTSSHSHPTVRIRAELCQTAEPSEDHRTASFLRRLDKDDQATEVIARSDSINDDITKATESEDSMKIQEQPGVDLQEVQQKEMVRSISEKTKLGCCGIAEPTPPSADQVSEYSPFGDTNLLEQQSLSPPEFTESILPIGAEISGLTGPPRPVLQPVSPSLTVDPVVPPLVLPPTIQALDLTVTSSQESTNEGEDLIRRAMSDETTEVGGGGTEVDKVLLGPSEVQDTSMDNNADEGMDDSREEGDPNTSSGAGQGNSAVVAGSLSGAEDININDNEEVEIPGQAKACSPLDSAQASNSTPYAAGNSVPDLESTQVSERFTSSEGRQGRSTSLPPVKGDPVMDTRARRSSSLTMESKPVAIRPLISRNETPPHIWVIASIIAEDTPSERDSDPPLPKKLSYRPRPRGRFKKRKSLDRRASQSCIAEPEAKRIKLRSKSIDSAAPRLSPPDFGGMIRYDTTHQIEEKARQQTKANPFSSHIPLSGTDRILEEDMHFEEAQAALTLEKRGLRPEAAIVSLRYPETPRTERRVGSSVQLMSSYPSTPEMIAETPGNMPSSPPCQTPSSGDRRKKRKAEDEKSQRALKKPFKPPLAPGKVLHRYLGSSSPPFIVNTDLLEDPLPPLSYSPAILSKMDHDAFPTFETAHSKRYITKRLTKPFKSPSVLAPKAEADGDSQSSDTIEPPSSPSRAPTRHKPVTALTETVNAPSRSAEINALESKKQMLIQAIKIINHQEEEARLTQLREQWLAAGREISEKLFSVIPEPANDSEPQAQGGQTYQGYYQDERPPVPPVLDEEAQVDGGPQGTAPEQKDWTIGSMLEMLSVDPDLFGWNEENEDWQE